MKTETIECECGTIFEWKNDSDLGCNDLFRPTYCDPCAERIEAENQRQLEEERERTSKRRLAEARASTANEIDKMTPPRYLATRTDHDDFNQCLWEKVEKWRPTSEVPFLGITGSSGKCKTRVGYMILRQLVIEGIRVVKDMPHVPRFTAVNSSRLSSLVSRQFFGDDSEGKEKARWELDQCRYCRFLLIDDIGKARNTPSVAAELFALINHRHEQNLPTIWTSNSSPEQFVCGMSEDMAGPLAGRLIECSIIIPAS